MKGMIFGQEALRIDAMLRPAHCRSMDRARHRRRRQSGVRLACRGIGARSQLHNDLLIVHALKISELRCAA